jgi:CDP-archaeol synthase
VTPDKSASSARTFFRATWLILPVIAGGLAHVAVLKANALGFLARPIDAGARWRGRPLFGENKSWRGFVVMTGATAVASGSQATLARWNRWKSALQASQGARINPWAAGAISGVSYCLAELPNSFLKRRLRIEPGGQATKRGRLQYLIDQGDSVVGCLVSLRLVYRAAADELLMAAALGMAVHIGIEQLIYAIGVKSRDYSPSHCSPRRPAMMGIKRLSSP